MRFRHRVRWGAGLAAFGLVLLGSLWRFDPPLPRVLDLRLRFATGEPGRSEPLIATGRVAAGDFFVVTYREKNTAVFSHDSWGPGGPSTAEIRFTPGALHRLKLEMPAVVATNPSRGDQRGRLRVEFDGRELLAEAVPFHPRGDTRLYFGMNPVGGNVGGVEFRGEIFNSAGRKLRGDAQGYFTRGERCLAWLAQAWRPLGWALLAGLAAAGLMELGLRWVEQQPALKSGHAASARAGHRVALIGAAICVAVFYWFVTGGTGKLFAEESFGSFYDAQAASLLRGRLDVPEAAIGGEAFVVGEKFYGYFGVTPALMRLPLAALGVGGGRLSRSFMLIDFTAALGAALLILRHATRLQLGPGARPSPWAITVLLGGAGLGSTLLFLGSRAYVYHEAILCGAALARVDRGGGVRGPGDSCAAVIGAVCADLRRRDRDRGGRRARSDPPGRARRRAVRGGRAEFQRDELAEIRDLRRLAVSV
ncbi:MAG: hypothetical protein RLZZ15_1742 [Verrucomicrobiota bacterium]|jgi:hypothetical protein